MNTKLINSAPVLFVSDISISLHYYCNVLDFKWPKLWGDPPTFAMPHKDSVTIMLQIENDLSKIQPKNTIWDIYIWVHDAKTLFDQYKRNGAIVVQEPIYKELYNNLEFILKDPDGYSLAFG
ncbi:MAG: VOC family protein, partial [Cyclobacteriaceae bacterium]